MGDDNRRECCEKECRDRCFQECLCDNGSGTNIIWILIILYLLFCFCGGGGGKGGLLGGLF